MTRAARALAFSLALLALPGLHAQEAPSEAALTVEEAEERLARAEAREDLEEAQKKRVVEIYRAAVGRLETRNQHLRQAEAHAEVMESGPQRLEALRRRLDTPPDTEAWVEDLPTNGVASVSELEQRLTKEQAELAEARNRLQELDQRLAEERTRPAAARDALAQAQAARSEAKRALRASPPSEGTLAEAARFALEAERERRTAEIEMLERELLSNEIRFKLDSAQRELAARAVARGDRRVAHLREVADRRRRIDAAREQRQAQRARRAASDKHPIVAEMAEENTRLSEELAAAVEALERAHEERTAIAARAEELDQDFQATRQRLEIAGLSRTLGDVLRRQRDRLPDTAGYRRSAAERKAKMGEVGLARFRAVEQQRELVSVDEVFERYVRVRGYNYTPRESETIESELAGLLADRRGLLDKLVATYTSYLGTLGEVDFAQRRLVEQAREFAELLDQYLLWIPSAPLAGLEILQELGPALAWLLAPSSWTELGRKLPRDLREGWLHAGFVALVLAALVGYRRRLKRSLSALAVRTAGMPSDRFFWTLQALVVTLLLAAPFPLAAGYVGWLLHAPVENTEFARAVGWGLIQIAAFVGVVLFWRVLCRRDGVGAAHFRWRAGTLALLRRNLDWFLPVAASAAFVVAVLASQSETAYRDSLARVAFLVLAASYAYFAFAALHPQRGVPAAALASNPDGWLARLRFVWYPLSVGAPIGLAVLAVLGYQFTARALEQRLIETLGIVLGAILVYQLVLRALFVARRRLEYRRARDRAVEKGTSTADSGPHVDPPEVDLREVDEQTRHLLDTLIGLAVIGGLWIVWADLLPAFGILEGVSLWDYSALVDGETKQVPVTLADVLLALLLGVLVVVAARNLPGVLEIAVLQRLPLEHGSRYAITTICQYTIFGVGVGVAFGILGLGWSQVQWLVAALGVGLGFGLQEIFANFVSGLIILFERPIRVGDTLTVADVTGKVSRIRIRATTIRDWDNREIVVPNKTFITGQLINWTLSDPITRVIIPIGIAYGSDTNRAYALIRETAAQNPMVLDEPPLELYFLGFGDSSLDFELRVYVRALADRLPVTHELHMAIERALREGGIEIPFPQRDIHVRSTVATAGFDRATERVAELREVGEQAKPPPKSAG